MRFARLLGLLVAFCGITAVLPAQVIISLPTDLRLAGATVIDFQSVSTGLYNSLTLSGVTFSASPNFTVDSSYAGNYNTVGQSINNNQGNVPQLNIDFSTPVSAFGFNFGASDVVWTLSAYDSSSTLLASMTIDPTRSSNAGDFFGLAPASGAITHVTVVAASGGDWIFVDNLRFTTTTVPEPPVAVLLGMGVLGLGLFRRFRRAAA